MSDRWIVAILESVAEGFVFLDRRWRCAHVNGRALDRLGAAKGE
jgi:hypothetical protein